MNGNSTTKSLLPGQEQSPRPPGLQLGCSSRGSRGGEKGALSAWPPPLPCRSRCLSLDPQPLPQEGERALFAFQGTKRAGRKLRTGACSWENHPPNACYEEASAGVWDPNKGGCYKKAE